jgi:hypothetical protein
MSYRVKIYFGICICLTGIILSFSAGCQEQQQATDLYLDGVMLKELGQNEMAVEKLNSAVKLNERLPLA